MAKSENESLRESKIELIKIDKKSKDKGVIKALFLEAFPKEERPPYCFLIGRAKRENVEFNGIYYGGEPVGLTYVISDEKIAYLLFFALDKSCRGRGLGGRVLEALKEKYQDKRLFLALEQSDETAKNAEQRFKRHRFYERHGFSDLPYRMREGAVVYDVMGIGGAVEPSEYARLMKDFIGIYRFFVPTRFIEK